MANTTIYNLPALNTVDSTSLFPLSSNVTATPTTYQASIGNIGNAITGNLRLTGDNLTSTNNSINVTASGNVWNFGSDGNLTLPTGTPSINYANGSPYGGGSGNANTGNVTFDNVNIIGTGNLKLQPDPANSGSYLDIFLTSGPDLHLVASQSANLILGKDGDANVMTSWNGNVYIQSWNQNTGAPNIWMFDGTGNLTAPGYIVLDTGTDGNIDSTGNINIISNVSTWTFGTDGEFYLPTGGRIGATKGGTMLDGGNGSLASLTSFYSNGFYSGCFTAQSDGNVYITTYPGSGSNVWQFGVDGNTTFPAVGAANLGNLATANYVNVSGNITSGNADLGNLAVANYFSTSGTGGNITLTGGNISGANVVTANTIQLTTIAIANLPSASTPGLKAFVNDSSIIPSGNFGVIVANGGANYTTVFSNGTDWLIG